MPRLRHAILLLCSFCIGSGSAFAQLTDFDRSRLADEIEAAAANLDPALFPQLDESQVVLADRITQVKQYFERAATAENRDDWLAYLDLDPLADAIEGEQSPAVLAREAMSLRYRLIGTAPGLELTALTNLRSSVDQLIEAIRFRDPDRSQESLSRQLISLAERVRALDDNPSADALAFVSALTGVLASSGQATGLVQSLRNTFGRPNAAILIGEPLVQTAVNQNVNQSRPVRDCILGTRIIGNATMSGVVTANLLPAVGAAKLNVTLVGNVVSNSMGYNGPVRLRTVGYGDVTVTRQVTVSESGISLTPAQAHVSLRTEIKSIDHKLRLVRKIARKRAAEQKPRAERIAAGKMRQQVGSQFAAQTREATSVTPSDVLAEVRPLLKRLSLEEPSRLWSSTEQAVAIDSTFRRHDQLSTVVSRPPISESYDAAIQLHESVIDNAVGPVLAGRTLSETQLNRLLEQVGRPLPPRKTTDEGDPEPPFEIDFHRLRPIIFEVRNQTLRLGVRGIRFAQGGREIKQAMEITAIYEPARTDEGVVILLRKGEVKVNFPGRKLSVRQAGLRPTIQKKFSDVFPEVVLDQPLEVPSDAQLEAIRGRVFRPRLVDANNGWLTIAVR